MCWLSRLQLRLTYDCNLNCFLHRLEMRFQRAAILFLRFKFRLQFLHQQFEPENFVAQLLNFGRRRCWSARCRRRRWRGICRCGCGRNWTRLSNCRGRFTRVTRSRVGRIARFAGENRLPSTREAACVAFASSSRRELLGFSGYGIQQALHPRDQILRLKRLAHQFIGFHRHRFLGDRRDSLRLTSR